jgi:hypothetical protein
MAGGDSLYGYEGLWVTSVSAEVVEPERPVADGAVGP